MELRANKKLDIKNILKDIENYRPRRRGWHWREEILGGETVGEFFYHDISKSLENSQPLPAAKYFNNIDPQPKEVITTEIASGRFEDDIRRMRMAAWHGADHIMVIRTAGQSHFDSLLEGTPQGIGGIPITRKQIRCQRKALDLIEDEVGRAINYHSYISGVAGPEIAVMFAEEGVNGAHQDPQYNILYRNINMLRSFVDAAEAKSVMAFADICQIDGAHNANATASKAWKVTPELMVQHAINSMFSVKVGMKKSNICLSTVPPTAPPAPCLKLDLPYAICLREIFKDYKMRAQMNTKYMESSTREATVTHVLNLLISKLTRADIQSTITPDEGRNVPWHIYNIEAVDTAKQALIGMDGLNEMIQINRDGVELSKTIRELKERAILFMEEMLEEGGYFEAVEKGFFVDSGFYPERNADGITRKIDGGVGSNTIFERDTDYFAPVSAHFGSNNVAQYDEKYEKDPSLLIQGDTFKEPSKIVFIDELDETDNVNIRLEEHQELRKSNLVKPEMEWLGDGTVLITLFLPTDTRRAEFASIKIGEKMGLKDVEVIHKEVMQESEGTRIELKGRVDFSIDMDKLTIPPLPKTMTEDELKEAIKERPIKVVAGTIGEDEHSVGLREIIDIKHGGIEKYGIECHVLGTSVDIEKLIDAAIELDADAILSSMIISHDDIHYKNMKKIHELAVEKGVREDLILIAGGTQVTDEISQRNGMDKGFGRGTQGVHVATFLVESRKEKIYES